VHFLLEMLNGHSVLRCDNHTTFLICSRTSHSPVSNPLSYSATVSRPLDLLQLELTPPLGAVYHVHKTYPYILSSFITAVSFEMGGGVRGNERN